jgi:hypothetical protein
MHSKRCPRPESVAGPLDITGGQVHGAMLERGGPRTERPITRISLFPQIPWAYSARAALSDALVPRRCTQTVCPSLEEATHPRCCGEGYPDRPGRASSKEGESWIIHRAVTMHNRRRPALPPVSTIVMLGNHAAYAHAPCRAGRWGSGPPGRGRWAGLLGTAAWAAGSLPPKAGRATRRPPLDCR